MATRARQNNGFFATIEKRLRAAVESEATLLRRLAVRWLAILHAVVRDVLEGQLTLRAMSLVYTALLSLVPLLAICFSVLKGFGVHNQVEPFLLNLLEPLGDKAAPVANQIVAFVDNMQVGVLGFVGFGLLFYTVVSLMQKIEESFNFIWKIESLRSFGERFRDYLSVLVVGPALMFTSLGIMASLTSSQIVTDLREIELVGWLIALAGRLLPTVMAMFVFSFVYVFVPNTKVHLRSAVLGGVVAGALWTAAGWLFAAFVASSANYTAVYSSFAAPLVFMIWLYVSWLILLVGADIAFYDQHPEHLFTGAGDKPMTSRACERLALSVAVLIGRHLYEGKQPWTEAALAKTLKVRASSIEAVLHYLEEGGLLTTTADDPPAYLPLRAFETTGVKELLDMVRAGGNEPDRAARATPAVQELQQRIDQALEQACEGLTLKDLALSAEAPAFEARVNP